jgi:hypothetical protein
VSFFFASSIQGNAPLDEIECPLAHRILAWIPMKGKKPNEFSVRHG